MNESDNMKLRKYLVLDSSSSLRQCQLIYEEAAKVNPPYYTLCYGTK